MSEVLTFRVHFTDEGKRREAAGLVVDAAGVDEGAVFGPVAGGTGLFVPLTGMEKRGRTVETRDV